LVFFKNKDYTKYSVYSISEYIKKSKVFLEIAMILDTEIYTRWGEYWQQHEYNSDP